MHKLSKWRLWSDLLEDDSGAVTVDWVVLSAAVIIAFFAMIVPVSDQVESLLNETGAVVENVITLAKSW